LFKFFIIKFLLSSFLKFIYTSQFFIFKEKKPFIFDQSIFEQKQPVYLDGYWQSYKYFDFIKSDLRRLYLTPKRLNKSNKEMLKKISSTPSICIHIRRGDYEKNPITKNFHGLLSLGYYKKGLKILKRSVANAHCFIFSDDTEWTRLNFRPNLPYTIVDINDQSKPYYDLWLMGHCKYFIIANSSFSWWPAYLSNFKNKIVIAPFFWLRHLKSKDTDLIPPDWIIVKN
jgi:hypothetical protein